MDSLRQGVAFVQSTVFWATICTSSWCLFTAHTQTLGAPFSFYGFATSLDVHTIAFGQVGLGTAFMVVMGEAEMGELLYSHAVSSLVRYIPSVLV